MKPIKYITAILFSAILFNSCIDLEREDYREIYPENFFLNENDIQLATNALYSSFLPGWQNFYSSDKWGYHVFTEMTTDALFCTWGWEWDALHLHTWYETKSGGDMSIFYQSYSYYNFLSTARNTIRAIENSSVQDHIKNVYNGEARALRGWMGLYLYDLFGPVPVASDEVLDNPQEKVYLMRLTEEEYDQFMEDNLLKAIEYLPETASARGRITKGAARMILLKYYMIKKNFAKAETLARDLLAMEGRVYELQSNYNSIFSKEDIGNKEIILGIPCNASIEVTSNFWLAHAVPEDYPYPVSTATMWGAYIIPWDFMDKHFINSNDTRLDGIITSYTNKGGTLVKRGEGNLAAGAYPMKYGVDTEMMGSGMNIDMVVYRFADVLLTLAECINENTGAPTPEAIGLVNRIRNRAHTGDLPSDAVSGKQVFNDAILAERGREFYAEGLRRQDLIRHGKYISSAQERTENQTASYKVRFPIPVTFITESKDNIVQNEGYR
jgi:hypothetical protein